MLRPGFEPRDQDREQSTSRAPNPSPTHSLTHSVTESPTHTVTHSCTHSPVQAIASGEVLIAVPARCQMRYKDAQDPLLLQLMTKVPKASGTTRGAWQFKMAVQVSDLMTEHKIVRVLLGGGVRRVSGGPLFTSPHFFSSCTNSP
jgi:hypothetical protein